MKGGGFRLQVSLQGFVAGRISAASVVGESERPGRILGRSWQPRAEAGSLPVKNSVDSHGVRDSWARTAPHPPLRATMARMLHVFWSIPWARPSKFTLSAVRQWAEALLTVGSAVSHPVGGILVGPDKPGGVHISRGFCSPGRFDGTRGKTENKTENESRDGPNHQKHGIERQGNSPQGRDQFFWSNASTGFQFVMLITVQFFFFLHRAALE